MNNNKLPWELKNTYDMKSNTSTNVIEYIVLSEFDIDTGSTVRHQYPISNPYCTEDWLAEHMLPEGVHNREEDWTYMFLNRESQSVSGADSDSNSNVRIWMYMCKYVHVSLYTYTYTSKLSMPIYI